MRQSEEFNPEILSVPEIDTLLESLNKQEVSAHQEALHLIRAEVDSASKQFKNIFEGIKSMDMIPMQLITDKVIPTVEKAADFPHIYHLFKELQLKSEYTYRHNICVGVIATYIGKWLMLSEKQLQELTLAATLHDIGKTMIHEDILNKPGKLTDEEYMEIQRHTKYGYELIKKVPGLPHSIALTAFQHHEREDGEGYPMKLKGNNIHLYAKIVAIADVFHAMSSKRVYHDAIPFYNVISQMHESVFGKLDPNILLLFMNKLMGTLVGKEVKLSNGDKGVIIMIHPYEPLRALVKTGEEIIDLRNKRDLNIVHVYS